MSKEANEGHLALEALLRGARLLLPEEWPGHWDIIESRQRQSSTKIVRLTHEGQPRLAFERLGEPFNFWMPVESLDAAKHGLPTPILRRRGETRAGQAAAGKNPGFHSNIANFFGRPDELWHMQFDDWPPVWTILKALSE